MSRATWDNEGGFALFMVLIVLTAVAVVSMGAVMLTGNSQLISGYESRQTDLEVAADGGLEAARAKLNGDPALYPDSGYTMVEDGAAVRDASGAVIPEMRRWTYVGPTAKQGGEDGVNASIISVTEDPTKHKVIRLAELSQESFAKFAYFTDVEGSIYFGGGDVLTGPVHSNDQIKVHSTGVTFRGPGTVTTAKTISNKQSARFEEGFTEDTAPIAMPTVADLDRLRSRSLEGGTAFSEPSGSAVPDQTRIRVEFGVDETTGDGYFKVYTAKSADFLMATNATGVSANNSTMVPLPNCGRYQSVNGNRQFQSSTDPSLNNQQQLQALQDPSARCLLGGAEELKPFEAWSSISGAWLARPFTWSNMPAEISSHADAAYRFPLSHEGNPNFKGVIYVSGNVGVSGTVRGRVTLAASGSIYVLDELKYSVAPGSAGSCTNADMLGLFAGGNIKVSDNYLNSPAKPQGSSTYRSFDDEPGVTIDGVILTLNTFAVQNYYKGATPSDRAARCGATWWGRGCLVIGGGVIQGTRGQVANSYGYGFLKRYQYDVCAAMRPPPYFPTTGRFSRGRYFEVDPVGFDVATYFRQLSSN